jgi:hypothetical protein
MEDISSGGNTGGTTSAPAASAPTTFAEAFASTPVDSPSAEPAVQDTTSPDTAVPGSDPAASPQQDERSPFIPRTRFDEVVTARKAAEQQLEEYKQRTGWAENQQLREAAERIARHQGNPLSLVDEIVQDLANHPEFGPQLNSLMARRLGSLRQQRQQQPAALEPPQPDIQVFDQNGQVVGHTYSDKAQAQRDAYLEQQLMAKIHQSLAPKLQTLETIQQERAHAQMQHQATTFASSFEQTAKEMFPAFDTKTHGPAIAAELAKLHLPNNTHPSVVEAAGLRALNKVMLPTLSSTAQSQLLDSLQQKAAASTAVNPASAAAKSTGNIRSFNDPSLTW